ncbi:MAG: protein-L-isoaspartate O-methyltransferase [Gammaproteobacteria bacterium]|nr:protein-L-isoaspartate O-methyltransferase [Gammaproteobacteria bacterium]
MGNFNFEQARRNMVDSQVRTWEVLDQRVLDVILQVPREDFVPAHLKSLAFADTNIPIGHDQVMMPPKVEGRLLQALEIRPEDKILEIGTGTGYLTACLARLGGRVHSVDIFEDFVRHAQEKLRAHGIDNVTLETGDAARGWAAHAPYDVIVVTGSVPELRGDFQGQLAMGGRLFVIVGESPVMEALRITRVGDDDFVRESLFDTDLRPLLNAPREKRFVF